MIMELIKQLNICEIKKICKENQIKKMNFIHAEDGMTVAQFESEFGLEFIAKFGNEDKEELKEFFRK